MDNTRSNQKNHIPLITVIFFFILVVIFAYDYLRLAALVSLSLFVAILFGYGLIWLASAWQELQKKADERYKNNLFVAPKDSQVIAIERRGKEVYHKKVHLAQNVYSNGHYKEPTPTEQRAFELFHGKRITSKKQPLLIEGESTETRQRTIFDVIEEGTHFSLIGPTKGGKSTLANHLIDHIKADETIVCDPHAKFNIWSHNAAIFKDYDRIKLEVFQIYDKMRQRYEDDNIVLDKCNSILLVIDEYPIVSKKAEVSEWIEEISSEGRKVKIYLILMSQSDLVQDTKINIAMRENFTKISLVPHLTQQNQAYIRHWDKEKELITLAGPYQKKLSFNEQIIDLWLNSGQSDSDITAITKQMYSSYGGNQRNAIKEIIEKYEKGLVNDV